jgi:hypothetical protein
MSEVPLYQEGVDVEAASSLESAPVPTPEPLNLEP